jgi:hypothetical protein
MEKLIKELREIISFKETIDSGDIILVAAKEPQMLMYGYVNGLERDSTRKDEWYHLHFTILSIPPQKVTWTLRIPQMTGQEVFTMGGEERFVQPLDLGGRTIAKRQTPPTENKKTKSGGLRRIK